MSYLALETGGEWGAAPTVERFELPAGDRGTLFTLEVMAAAAAQPNRSVRDVADVELGPAATPWDLRAWLDIHTDFVPDPVGHELVTMPGRQLWDIARTGVAWGDCDDVATLGAALALASGWRARFVVVGFDGERDPFSHVWTEAFDPLAPGLGWVELDTTREKQGIARVPRIGRLMKLEIHPDGSLST